MRGSGVRPRRPCGQRCAEVEHNCGPEGLDRLRLAQEALRATLRAWDSGVGMDGSAAHAVAARGRIAFAALAAKPGATGRLRRKRGKCGKCGTPRGAGRNLTTFGDPDPAVLLSLPSEITTPPRPDRRRAGGQ